MRRPLCSVFLLLALASGCAPLEDLEPYTCGNGVIDTLANEDCDTWEYDGHVCQMEGEWACSFQCDEHGKCPSHYGCGVDGICRRPTGQFELEPSLSAPSDALELLGGDFDADGRADVAGVEPGHLRVYFGASSGDLPQTSFSSLVRPAIGKLGALGSDGADAGDDLVLPINLGVGALVSGANKTFTAKAYSSVSFDRPFKRPDGTKVHAVDVMPLAIDALPGSGNEGDEMAALVELVKEGTDPPESYTVFTDFNDPTNPCFTVSGGKPSNLLGPPVTGQFDSNSCQQVAFPIRGANRLSVYNTCTLNALSYYVWARFGDDEEAATLARIELGDAAISGPAFARDVNADGHTDLLITASYADAGLMLMVAYGVGNGRFASAPPAPGQTTGNNVASLYAFLAKSDAIKGHVPLALGDLNKDGYPDLVDSRQVLFGGPGANAVPAAFTPAYTSLRSWDEAIIADVNGNGYPDVVAAAKDARDIDVLGGNPSMFVNPLQIPTEGKVAHLTAGDYDGDLVSDIAFREGLTTTQSRLMISYGRTAGGPEEPSKIGDFDVIDRIVSGNVHSFQSDSISDLGVVTGIEASSASPQIELSFLPGSANRFIVAPFFLPDPEKPGFDVPLQTALGALFFMSAGNHNDLAVLAQQQLDSTLDITSDDGLKEASGALRLWAIPGAGDADFSSDQAPVCRVPPGPFFSPVLAEAVSLMVPPAGDGSVFIGAPYLEGEGSAMVVRSILAQLRRGEPPSGKEPPNPGQDCFQPRSFLAAPGQVLQRVRMVELNGNGTPEILALMQQYDAHKLSNRLRGHDDPADQDKPLEVLASVLWVFWDVTSPTSALTPHAVTDKATMMVSDYAVGDTDGDGLSEVIAAGPFGLARYVAKKGSRALAADVATQVAGSNDAPQAGGPRALLIEDVDGDGVNDVVMVNGSSALEVFRGAPRTLIKDLGSSAK